jgi:hypothetical protein
MTDLDLNPLVPPSLSLIGCFPCAIVLLEFKPWGEQLGGVEVTLQVAQNLG